MSKLKKNLLILIISVVIVMAAVITVSFLKKKNKDSKVVSVYAASEIGYYNNFNYQDMLYGNVQTTNEQRVYVNSNQLISEIKVEVGDEVKIGDVLLVYDTTAQSLQLQTLATEVELARVAVLVAERELEELKNTTPIEETTEAPTTVEPTTEAPTTTQEPTTEEPVEPATPSDATPGDATTEIPITDEETTEAPTTEEPTTEAPVDEEATVGDEALEEEKTYTEKELKQAIKDKEAEIVQLVISYQIMQVSYSIMEYQIATGELICTCNGVVREVNDPEEAITNNQPLIVVGQTEGYIVETAIGELKLGKVSVGDTVTMMCYDDGMTYTGIITDISNIPYDENYYGPGESYYPMTVSVIDAESLTMGMYMEMYLDSDGSGEESFYMSAAFIIYENGGYYVYKDVDNVLKKCPVVIGNVSYGEYEIISGINQDDYIAFPHSSDVAEGVKTKKESVDKLYN
ncbi:MAG: hypothetical protein IJO70_02795 [Lachnospiraceae bacterium]|nr:hypothetical protein [Lachnospiraceae bacterium]